MRVLERYSYSTEVHTRRCQDATVARECIAEFIVHDHTTRHFLCARHAARLLKENKSLLAKAVVQLFLGK